MQRLSDIHRRNILAAAGAVVALAVVALYLYVDPSTALFPKCPLKALTGYDCPGCGSQRAFHAILNGDFTSAWRLNAALFIGVPLIVMYFTSALWRGRAPRIYKAINSPWAAALIAAATVAWWIARNL